MIDKIKPKSNFLFKYKKGNYFESKEFYKKHVNLVPRNVYLSEGRIMTLKEVQKGLDKIVKKSFSEKVQILFDKVKQIFVKK